MGIQVAGTQLQWSQLSSANTITHSHAAFATVSLIRSVNRRGAAAACGGDRVSSSLFLGSGAGKMLRSRSVDNLRVRKRPCEERTLRRVVSASVEHFDNEDDPAFVRKIEQLAIELLHQQGKSGDWMVDDDESSSSSQPFCAETSPPAPPPSVAPSKTHDPSRLPLQLEPPDWSDQMVPASVGRFSTSVDLPLSLRILKRKMRGEDRWFLEASESACCSMKLAFSSMLFIIRELHSYTIQMREVLFYEDVQGIAGRVQHELNSSFIWLFQQIFSCTPTLMVSLMLLLANFTVYSMRNTDGPAMVPLNRPAQQSLIETAAVVEDLSQNQHNRSSFKIFSSLGRVASFRGSGAGWGGTTRPLASATGEEQSDAGSPTYRTLLPDEISTTLGTTKAEEVEGGISAEGGAALAASEAEEARIWKGILEEAYRMQASTTDDTLMDSDTRRHLVSPVSVELEPEERSHYLPTEVMYYHAVAQEPENPLLLTNYAQFIFVVLHDHDRAEYYFKKAVAVLPSADALSRYANFLWIARKDLETAEEIYLQAMDAEPDNSFHAGNYAYFLWNTGGEDTCYPLGEDGQA